MAKPSLDVWIVESSAVYTEVPFGVVVDWIQQGRLLSDDRVRAHGKNNWHPLAKVAAFAPYLPKSEPFETASVSESLEPVDLGWKWKRPEETEDEDVDMIPLIDISLVLLIFFMMTATVRSSLFSPIDTPQTNFPADSLAVEQLWIGIDAKGPGLPDPEKRPWFSLGQDNKQLVAPTTQVADVMSAARPASRPGEGGRQGPPACRPVALGRRRHLHDARAPRARGLHQRRPGEDGPPQSHPARRSSGEIPMTWRFRREGSTQEAGNLTTEQLIAGLYEGKIEPTDEVRGTGDAAWQSIENQPEFAEICAEIEPPLPSVRDEPTSLDMNPLIDVCLVLLVFFILTTSYAVAVLKVIPLQGKRDPSTGIREVPKDQLKKFVRVEATKTAAGALQIRIENQTRDVLDAKGKLDPSKLTAALREYSHGADRRTEMLLDARGIDWGTVVSLQDAAKAAEIRTIDHVLPKK